MCSTGVEAIVVHGGGIADVAQHFCNKYEILTIKVRSTRRMELELLVLKLCT